MATVELTNAIGANTDTTDPFARLPNESFVDYLKRIKNVRGMLLGQYAKEAEADPVDDALADTISSQPLGQEVVRDGGDGGDGGPVDTRTPYERKLDTMERAVGLLSGDAASAIGLGSIAGPFGMALGGFADYNTVSQFEDELERQGFTSEEIEVLKDNPDLLQQGLTRGVFGVKSEGYQPTIVDKLGITGMLSNIFDTSKPTTTGTAVDALRAKITGMTPNYPGYVAPTMTNQGMLTGGYGYGMQPAITGGASTSTVPTNLVGLTSAQRGALSQISGMEYMGGEVVGVNDRGQVIISTDQGDRRVGSDGNTYNFNLGDYDRGNGGSDSGSASSASRESSSLDSGTGSGVSAGGGRASGGYGYGGW